MARNSWSRSSTAMTNCPILSRLLRCLTDGVFCPLLGVPDTLMVIALGAAFATTDPDAFEQHARPFKDVFLVIFFVFFGITINLSGSVSLGVIAIICLLAIVSKLISGVLTGIALYGSAMSGLEIWGNTIGTGRVLHRTCRCSTVLPRCRHHRRDGDRDLPCGVVCREILRSLSRGFGGKGRRHGPPPHRIRAGH